MRPELGKGLEGDLARALPTSLPQSGVTWVTVVPGSQMLAFNLVVYSAKFGNKFWGSVNFLPLNDAFTVQLFNAVRSTWRCLHGKSMETFKRK